MEPYYHLPAIKEAINIVPQRGTSEDEVTRYMSGILTHYFPIGEDWTVVPQYRTTNNKIPDFTVENFLHGRFNSRIYVELKSTTGDSIPAAMIQLTGSVILRFGDGETNEGFLIVVKGTSIAFLEYFAYLDDGETSHFHRAIPFNRVLSGVNPGSDRPRYQGQDTPEFPDRLGGPYVLDVEKDKDTVHSVLKWIKCHPPRDLSNVVDDYGFFRQQIFFQS